MKKVRHIFCSMQLLQDLMLCENESIYNCFNKHKTEMYLLLKFDNAVQLKCEASIHFTLNAV